MQVEEELVSSMTFLPWQLFGYITMDQSQGQAHSTQASAPEAPVLQTPLNEERARKRDRQEKTPTGASTEQQVSTAVYQIRQTSAL